MADVKSQELSAEQALMLLRAAFPLYRGIAIEQGTAQLLKAAAKNHINVSEATIRQILVVVVDGLGKALSEA